MKQSKYKFKKEGVDLFVGEMIVIKYPEQIVLGDHVALDNFISFSASANIGDYVHIAPGVTIIGGVDSKLIMGKFSGISANSTMICGSDDFTKGMLNPQVPIKYRKPKISNIIINDYACVGVGCIVFPGVTLGEGSVVGAGSVVTKDTKPWGIYLGSPAKLIGHRDKTPILKGAKELGYSVDALAHLWPYNKMNKEFEIWGDKDWSYRLDYDLDENSIVIDAGGYKGWFAEQIFNKYNCTVYVFEPVKEFYDNLINKFNTNNKIIVFNCALGGKSQNVQINLQGDASSIHNETENFKGHDQIHIESISDFINKNRLQTIDLIKLNIEGEEFSLLECLIEKNELKRFNNFQIQFHSFIENSIERRNNIRKSLSEDFSLEYDFEFVWEGWKQQNGSLA